MAYIPFIIIAYIFSLFIGDSEEAREDSATYNARYCSTMHLLDCIGRGSKADKQTMQTLKKNGISMKRRHISYNAYTGKLTLHK